LASEAILTAELPFGLAWSAAARALAVTIAIGLTTGLTHRELGFLAFRHVTFRSRESRPNQAAVHRPVIVSSDVVIRNTIGVAIRRRITRGGVSVVDRRGVYGIRIARYVVWKVLGGRHSAGNSDGAGTRLFDSVLG